MAPSSSPTSAASVTLRLATVEALGSPEAQAIAFFADEVKRLSGGTVLVSRLIESADRDAENIEAVTSGAIEMIITQARNWDEFGVTSMQALQTPFLITSSALAVSATTGDLADELISGLHSKGVDGLALWPTDLRHPVSFGAPLVSPADFKGIEFRIPGSTIAKLTVTTLGAVPVDEFDASVRGGDSAFRRAPGLPRPNTFTGNVTFNPRVDVLVIASSAFDALSAAQQTAVRAAASSTRQHMIDSIVPDKDQAKSYCADLAGAVVLASAAQLQAFRTALAPVEATIAGDALSKKLIDTIRTLGRTVPPEAAVSPCGTPGK